LKKIRELVKAALSATTGDSLSEQLEKIYQAFWSKFGDAPAQSAYVKEVYDDAVIADAGDGCYRIGYSVDTDGVVTFDAKDQWQKVEQQYVPTKASTKQDPISLSFRGAVDVTGMVQTTPGVMERGTKWEVTILKFGKIKTPPYYLITKDVVEKYLLQFEGAKVYANTTTDLAGHLKDSNRKSVRDIVGVMTGPWIAGEELKATLTLYPSADDIRKNLVFASDNSAPMPYELSIDATGEAERKGQDIVATSFDRVMVDFVERGAADGVVVRMVASKLHPQGDTSMKEKLLFLFSILWPTFLVDQKVELPKVNENELMTHLVAANKAHPRFELPDGINTTNADEVIEKMFTELGKSLKPAPIQAAKTDNILDLSAFRASVTDPIAAEVKKMQIRASQFLLSAKLADSKLPVPFQDELKVEFKDKVAEEADIDAAIKRKKDIWASLVPSQLNNRGLDIRAGMDQVDKVKNGIYGLFLEGSLKPLTPEEKKTLNPYQSIKAAYIDFTGDDELTGRRDFARFQATLQTGDWSQIVADAMNKRLVRDYPLLGLDTWRQFAEVVPLSDFKTQHRVRWGGYSNLPVVAQAAPYLPLTSPTDEEATYVPAKHGGTEGVTRELIMNDDIGALRGLTRRLTRAGFQSVHEAVYDIIKPALTTESVGSPTLIYDGTALYTTAHGNKATTAMGTDGVAIFAMRLRMAKQADMDNSKRLALKLGYVLTPPDLEESAYKSLVAAFGQTNMTETFVQNQRIQNITVDYWTDATDWAGVARDKGGLEVGFVNGQDTPEIFVSDLPNVGSWFTNDVITYKIRYEWGIAVLDYRYFQGSVVSG